jgi:hypothetical protein
MITSSRKRSRCQEYREMNDVITIVSVISVWDINDDSNAGCRGYGGFMYVIRHLTNDTTLSC